MIYNVADKDITHVYVVHMSSIFSSNSEAFCSSINGYVQMTACTACTLYSKLINYLFILFIIHFINKASFSIEIL